MSTSTLPTAAEAGRPADERTAAPPQGPPAR